MSEDKRDPILDRMKVEEAKRIQEMAELRRQMLAASTTPVRDITVTQHIATALVSAMMQNPTGGGKVLQSTASMEAASTLAVQLARMIVVQSSVFPDEETT